MISKYSYYISREEEWKFVNKTGKYPNRLINEYNSLMLNPIQGVVFYVSKENAKFWKFLIEGPKSSVYKAGLFILYCTFPDNYPFKMPELRLGNKIYHPLFSEDGDVCDCEFFQNEPNYWVPYTIRKLLQIIIDSLNDPFKFTKTHFPVIKDLLENDKEKFKTIANEFTLKYL